MSFILNFYLVLTKRQALAKWISDITKSDKNIDLIESSVKFYDSHLFFVNGKYHNDKGLGRLPEKFKEKVRKEIWSISRQTSGMNIHFSTNSTLIFVKWKLGMNVVKPNMSRIGSGGVDLYCKKNGTWQFVNAIGPNPDGETCKSIISDMDTGFKEFMINFPLFDEVLDFEIGIHKTAEIKKYLPTKKKAIVFYGTSITQGSSASRPGMAYPSIVSRALNTPVYNLGFDGNGKFEIEFSDILSETNSKLFVIDCVTNSHPELIRTKALPLILKLHQKNPTVPILLIETITRENTYLDRKDSIFDDGYRYIKAQNKMLSLVFDQAKQMGIQNIFYIKGEGLIGYDHEGTIDGTHLNDIGSMRYAKEVQEIITKILYYHN